MTVEFEISSLARKRLAVRAPLLPMGARSAAGASAVLHRVCDALRASDPGLDVKAGDLNALILIDAVFHRMLAAYRTEKAPRFLSDLEADLRAELGPGRLDALQLDFLRAFPPLAVYLGDRTAPEALRGTEGGASRRQLELERLLLLWVANRNAATAPFLPLIDETTLADPEGFARAISVIRRRARQAPPLGPDGEGPVAMLLLPAQRVPHSLPGQLAFILEHFREWVGELASLLHRGIDLVREEASWTAPGGGPARLDVPDFTSLENEEEAFSPDLDWMPQVVLMAKNAHVWLDQIARRTGRDVRRLDQIPDEELDRLARWGFTGLWLIGLWERSPASRVIKRRCGNPEAMSSAYAVFDYQVATDLGGEDAFQDLKHRAASRGIRLASDMVPNHTGIDSRWLVDRPDHFLSLDAPPYPVYRFDDPDLSWSQDVSIRIESHYWDRSDAAVVFRLDDHRTGATRYVYHGNDGTSTPWNDTAQLDHLNPEVREALIQAVLSVARKSPIIRFDAAMTLAKRHYQRLWHPEPGSGGAIPSRAERGLTREAFHRRMPVEFWRELVDRVREEAPDTLLLAEAFWLMEGYFVRTLGMHRVYNSAFMNMLAQEDNAKYRQVLKNTLEFDTGVLQRFVNFLSNPDEDPAVEQFGKGDKYFGICTLMATLPGLPMFGHGQVEGLAEKYGMEYGRAYWDEHADPELIARHERQVFPLLRRRGLFAGAHAFRLYDLHTGPGNVNEDVIAYSNRSDGDRALVVYNNRYARASGWLCESAAFAVKEGDRTSLVRETLSQGLALPAEDGLVIGLREHVSGQFFLHRSRDLAEKGLPVELGAYQCRVYLDIRHLRHTARHPWADLCLHLAGRGVADLDAELEALRLEPVRAATGDLSGWIGLMLAGPAPKEKAEQDTRLDTAQQKAETFFQAAATHLELDGRAPERARAFRLAAEDLLRRTEETDAGQTDGRLRHGLLAWAMMRSLGEMEQSPKPGLRGIDRLEQWGLAAAISSCDQVRGVMTGLLRLARAYGEWADSDAPPAALLASWFDQEPIRAILGVHSWDGKDWVVQEGFERLVTALDTVRAHLAARPIPKSAGRAGLSDAATGLIRLGRTSNFQVDRLLTDEEATGEEPEDQPPSTNQASA